MHKVPELLRALALDIEEHHADDELQALRAASTMLQFWAFCADVTLPRLQVPPKEIAELERAEAVLQAVLRRASAAQQPS
jgi:hypothetical protein